MITKREIKAKIEGILYTLRDAERGLADVSGMISTGNRIAVAGTQASLKETIAKVEDLIYEPEADPGVFELIYEPEADPGVFELIYEPKADPGVFELIYEPEADPGVFELIYEPEADPGVFEFIADGKRIVFSEANH
jgi:energy-coupling factor transporter ATP-binding protein EcfA2